MNGQMNRDRLPDLNISGISSAGGGYYGTVRIEGVGTVKGDVVSREFHLNGVGTIDGSLETDRMTASGKLKIDGKLEAENCQLDGLADVTGFVSVDSLLANGLLNVRGDCDAERFVASGGFTIDGMLNAGVVDISLYGKGKAREIGCESIRTRKVAKSKWSSVMGRLFSIWAPELRTETIEGDDIDLEYTVASVVRGNRVTIGPGCRIGKVEYRSEYRKHPAAKVREERKSGEGNDIA